MRNTSIFLIFLIGLITFASGSLGMALETAPYRVGNMTVDILSVQELEISSNILQGINSIVLEEKMPSSNFMVPVNVMLIRNNNSTTLIDAGVGDASVTALNKYDLSPAAIDTILLTHMHFDHIEGLLDQDTAVFPQCCPAVSRNEYDYWRDRDNIAIYPKELQGMMTQAFALCNQVFTTYAERLHIFSPGELEERGKEIIPGIHAIATYGHTPGHVSFLLRQDNEEFFITGDEILSDALQFAAPDITTTFDIDQKQAAATRIQVFKFLAQTAMPFTGSHLPQPSIGVLRAADADNDTFVFERQTLAK